MGAERRARWAGRATVAFWAVVGVALGSVASVVVTAAAWLVGWNEWDRVASPNGEFVSVIEFQGYRKLMPRPPGSGGDLNGRIDVVRVRDGRSCGQVELPMVSMAADLRWWNPTANKAVIIGVAEWDLGHCTVSPW